MSTQNEKQAWSTQEYWQERFDTSNTPWELGAPSSVVLEACSELGNVGVPLDGSRVLSPGCGRGSDALELVARGSTVIAVEWSAHVAHDLINRHRVARIPGRGSLEVRIGDFFVVEPEPVDIVCEHTFLCALDPTRRAAYAQRIASWLKPGGFLCGNFFVVSDDEASGLPGLSLTKEGVGPPFGITKGALVDLLDGYFSVVKLHPGLKPAEGRRPGLEWVGLFKRMP